MKGGIEEGKLDNDDDDNDGMVVMGSSLTYVYEFVHFVNIY